MISIPVHVWLPGCADPANAGVLEVDDRSAEQRGKVLNFSSSSKS
jgi:hypothetical protein